jgi:hypothetical protein
MLRRVELIQAMAVVAVKVTELLEKRAVQVS